MVLTFFSYCLSDFTPDEVWNYGFSYNIACGLVPYRDFNMVIGPLYNLIIGFFLIPLGNNLLAFHLINNIIISIFIVLIYKKIDSKCLIMLLFFMFIPTMHSYNTFVALLTIGIIMLEDSSFKYKDILVGVLIGCIFITKQNVGLFLILACIIISNDRIKAVGSFMIPLIALGVFLLITNSTWQYIDFCFLGIGSFLDNFIIEIVAIILEIVVILYLIYKFFKTRDKKILYLLSFQVIAFPIIDCAHVLVGIVPVLFYFLLNDRNKTVTLLIKTFLIVTIIFQSIIAINGLHIKQSNFSKYRYTPYDIDNYTMNFSRYVLEKEKDYDVYLFINNAYFIRLTLNQNPDFYDLINNGNLGSDLNKYTTDIKENCKKKSCLFVLDKRYFYDKMESQLNLLFRDFVINNFEYLETLPSDDRVYKN